MLRRLLAGSDGAAQEDGSGEEASSSSARRNRGRGNDSLCARFCQLPQYLVGDHANPFVAEPGTGVARLPSAGGAVQRRQEQQQRRRGSARRGGNGNASSNTGGNSNALSPLRRREKEENSNLKRFLLAGEEKLTPAEAEQEASILAQMEGIGEECDICSLKVATHFALPCRHRACKVCWSRWLADHEGCMVCVSKVVSLRRFPEDMLPLTPYELQEQRTTANGTLKVSSEDAVTPLFALQSELIVVEEAFERCVRSILHVKDSLAQILEALETVESHLFNITRPDPGQNITVESLTSVLAVERSTVVEQLTMYDNIFADNGDWVAMDHEMVLLQCAVQSYGQRLDTFVEETDKQSGVADEDGLGGGEAAASKQTSEVVANAIDVFEVLVASNSMQAQWARLKTILERCGPDSSLMMGIMRVFGMIQLSHSHGGESNDIPAFALRVMSSAQSRLRLSDERLSQTLLPEGSFALQRLQSMAPDLSTSDQDASGEEVSLAVS
ncbi:E3 ubiquitin-protein ligase RNF149 [Hondaea fermentalgiana]|uniref:E3 ubiquitin-protein ligase RNF149 n=1 Tax=Hondaea fermentalgiana TaxID=2315210 RepID=A0A2R5GRH2_9STRA|nr:E3 ubiquitin-protein ligase RNF149 [Hondaea fermentalgiana]|eukprot:GBG30484.1 E3 ubiquitin-protein ligase RNF149 [Hondaea fermentalgiana]